MEFSTLRNSFSLSIKFDVEKAADVAAIAVGKATRAATRHVLGKAIADTRTLIAAERTAKTTTWNVVSNTIQVAKALVTATDARIDAVIDARVITPVTQAKAAIAKPIAKGWNASLDIITDYLESTPVQAAKVKESFPISNLLSFEGAIAEARPFSEDWGHKAIQAANDGHVLVGDQVITEDGVINTTTAKGKKVKPRKSSLSGLIREEVAKR